MARARSDLLQITLFKDQDSARSIQVPMAWLRRVALLGLLLVAAVVLISLVALREFRAARRFDPSRVVDLEQQVAELREAHELRLSTPGSTTTPAEIAPENLMGPVPLNDLPAFTVETPQLTWKDGGLQIQLILKYSRGDGRSQAGTLVFLAQTNSGLQAFPDGVLTASAEGEPQLLASKGERFNVSKQRETNAVFAHLGGPESLKGLTLLLFGPDQKLLQKERLDVSSAHR